MKDYNTLVFEGGGVRGICYTGCLNKLEELDILKNIKYVSGTSAGSQAAALVACGMNAKDIEKSIFNLNFEKLLDSSWGFMRDLYRFFTKYGYHKGVYIEQYMEKLLYSATGIQDIDFETLYNKKKIHLKITGTCINTQKLEWFDHVNTPRMSVARAVHISSCIPFVFKPVLYNNKYYVDGGCLDNLPYNAFDGEHIVGLALNLTENLKKVNITNLKEFSMALTNTVIEAANSCIQRTNKFDEIKINTGSISGINFKLSYEDKVYLKNCGYKATESFFSS